MRSSLTPDDSGNAPTNSKLFFAVENVVASEGEFDVFIVGPDGISAVDTTFDGPLLAGEFPFAADTSYTLIVRTIPTGTEPGQVDTIPEPGAEGDQFVLVRRELTTGASTDDTPPRASLGGRVTTSEAFGSVLPEPCGDTDRAGTSAFIPMPVVEDESPFGVKLVRVEADGSRRVVEVFFEGDDEGFDVFENEGGVVSFELVAFDLAGNESEPLPVQIDFGLDGGCAATGTSNAVIGAAALALLLFRRRSQRGAQSSARGSTSRLNTRVKWPDNTRRASSTL